MLANHTLSFRGHSAPCTFPRDFRISRWTRGPGACKATQQAPRRELGQRGWSAGRPRQLAGAAVRSAATALSAAPSSSGTELDAGSAVLQWACQGWEGPELDDEDGDNVPSSRNSSSGPALAVGVRDLGAGRGRGLVALRDVGPGETLLSVSMERVFCSEPESELHWSADMALRLLKARHASSQQQQQQQPQAEQGRKQGAVDWGAWIRSLPTAVRTPLEYGDAELGALDEYTAAEVAGMQQCVADCFEAVQPELEAIGCGWGDFLWAVQVFHSRCFFEPNSGRHMTVPGVDMANHTAAPTAGVRIVHPMSQGWDAVAEIAEPPPPEPSRFTLVAGEAGIRRGEEVTISYGSWPSEAFLLLFGFVPSPCPGEALTMFRDAEELVRWCLARHPAGASTDGGHQPDEEAEEARVVAVMEGVAAALAAQGADATGGGAASPDLGDYMNLVVTPQGIDGRLEPLLAAAAAATAAVVRGEGQELAASAPEARQLLVARLRERAAEFGVGSASHSGARADAGESLEDPVVAAFRASKRAVAEAALVALTGAVVN